MFELISLSLGWESYPIIMRMKKNHPLLSSSSSSENPNKVMFSECSLQSKMHLFFSFSPSSIISFPI